MMGPLPSVEDPTTFVVDDEQYGEEEFYGLDVLDHPPEQLDDEIQYLNEVDRQDIIEAETLVWKDCLISDENENVTFLLDESVKEAWTRFKEEVIHIRENLQKLLNKETSNSDDANPPPIEFSDLVSLAFGKDTDFANTFSREAKIADRPTFLRFIATLCLQMSYKESPSCLYEEYSQLKEKIPMKQAEYLRIWKEIATSKKVKRTNFIGSSRREECLWEKLERVVNVFLRKITIVGRADVIETSMDDDKCWADTSGQNAEDDFGLRRVTHVKDNRKGIISHTAVSATTTVPLSFIFERNGDRAVDCFQRIFSQMFTTAGRTDGNLDAIPDLNGVINHSDRGYTLESTIFDFFLPAGGDFTNTVKRIRPFPFIWGMKPSQNDDRELLDEKGAPALFVKETSKHGRSVTCAAFRTGTKNISAVVTSMIHGHQWEGVCLSLKQRVEYENDKKHGLDKYIFQPLTSFESLFDAHKDEIKSMLDELMEISIDVITLEQGTADWHKARQFSITSSQSAGAFKTALVIYQSEDDWCEVASFLFGEKYHECELIMT